ncbi:MAG: protease modulator HflC [Planctomycetota bacterium]|nr:protease modulator HflC [Planctomycetota bacterium]
MRKTLIYLVTSVFLVALLAFACTFTVRFTEAAVVTTLGKADENDVIKSPGLRFKVPYFQSVTKYDTRVRVLSTRLETLNTADNRQVVIETFCTWRVSDPLKFFQRFSNAGSTAEEHYKAAEGSLKGNIRAAGALVSRYRIDQLFTATSGASATPLNELEENMKKAFESSNDSTGLKLDDYGIAAVDVGITRIVLPEETTKAVFERMKVTREGIAKATESEGNSRAQSLRAEAESQARKISDFAERLAQEIRNRGDLEAAPYFAQMNTNPDLAVFIENMDFIRQTFGKRTTLVLSGSMPGVNLLFPNALERLKSGQIPTPTEGNWLSDSMQRPTGGTTKDKETTR